MVAGFSDKFSAQHDQSSQSERPTRHHAGAEAPASHQSPATPADHATNYYTTSHLDKHVLHPYDCIDQNRRLKHTVARL